MLRGNCQTAVAGSGKASKSHVYSDVLHKLDRVGSGPLPAWRQMVQCYGWNIPKVVRGELRLLFIACSCLEALGVTEESYIFLNCTVIFLYYHSVCGSSHNYSRK